MATPPQNAVLSTVSSPGLQVSHIGLSSRVRGIDSNILHKRLESYSPLTSSHRVRRRKEIGYSSKKKSLVVAEGGKEPWDFGRFIKTLYYFNGPPSLGKFIQAVLGRITSDNSVTQPLNKNSVGELVLVAGATGGVGKRIVDTLLKKGIPVRALVRNAEKARSLLGTDVDIVVADITQRATLLPEYFTGVKKVINAASCIVGPKEGDTNDRAKYYQGIKFFEPEVKGDTPEAVEYFGMKNLIDAVKNHIGFRDGKIVTGFDNNGKLIGQDWGSLDDVVMGGVSESSMQIGQDGDKPVCLFKGFVSTNNNGGFASIRTKNFVPSLDLSSYEGVELYLKGDGHRFKFVIRNTEDWDAIGYTSSFDTEKGQWQKVRLPFSSFMPIFRARTAKDAPSFDSSRVTSLQLMYSKFEYDGKLNPTFEPGAFQLPVAHIKAYLKEPITPRFVHVSSAGVTRPDRPGLDLSKQPPAVRLNKELNYILTFKLKGEDVLRESGIPYTIVRPCALTEEPAGADLIFEQGDNITVMHSYFCEIITVDFIGKISREEIARICLAALDSPAACDINFEVKSTIPFSEPFTIDANNPPPEKDYNSYFKLLKKGITGKEALVDSGVPV